MVVGIDERNRNRLKREIFAAYGFPTLKVSGQGCDVWHFLMIQHADGDGMAKIPAYTHRGSCEEWRPGRMSYALPLRQDQVNSI